MKLRGVTVDVTARRELEEQLRQAQKMEAVGQLAGGVAHDFNNLLTAIIGYAELAARAADGRTIRPRARRRGDRDAPAQRAAALTRQLLAFSRQQVLQRDGRSTSTPSSRDIEKMLRRLIGEDIELVHRRSDARPADGSRPIAGQLEQVLMNLAVNARDAMPEGGTLTHRDRATSTLDGRLGGRAHARLAPGSYVVLAVSDTGAG